MGALALVLLEDHGVEAFATVVQGIEALAQTGHVLTGGQRQDEAHAQDPLAVVQNLDLRRSRATDGEPLNAYRVGGAGRQVATRSRTSAWSLRSHRGAER